MGTGQGEEDVDVDEDEEGRMFGGGLNEDQKTILDLFVPFVSLWTTLCVCVCLD